jgi:hypothetical protein
MSYKLPGEFITPPTPANVKGFVEPAQAYKPAQQLVFDHKGETLVYESDNRPNYNVFFPIPWSLGTWSIPVGAWQVIEGNIPLNLVTVAAAYLAIMPHCIYLYNLGYVIDKVWYIRGGHWKIQTSGIYGYIATSYTSPENIEFSVTPALNNEGQLDSDLSIVSKIWHEFYDSKENQTLQIPKIGKVSNPELFLAMLQKLKIDDSNFVVNLQVENA